MGLFLCLARSPPLTFCFLKEIKIRKDKRNMEIKYKFINGEETSIEVYGDFEEIILDLDRDLKNNNRKETRRHESLNLLDSDKQSIATNTDVYSQTLKNLDKDKLYAAIAKLKPQEQELLRNLYLSDKPMTQRQYANISNIKEKSVQEKSRRIRKKLKELIYEETKDNSRG